MVAKLGEYEVIVRFGSGIPASIQGEVMLDMEKNLRRRGLPALVFKDVMRDDSKLRSVMTAAQRAKL